jgi:hypothetical protein
MLCPTTDILFLFGEKAGAVLLKRKGADHPLGFADYRNGLGRKLKRSGGSCRLFRAEDPH